MRRIPILLTAILVLAASVAIGGGSATGAVPPRAPAEFFGIGPQTVMTQKDAEYMKAGGIGVVRLALPWSSIQSSRRGGYDWAGFDEAVAVAARAGLRVMPFFWGTPHWLAAKPTTLPIDSARAREAWKAFLTAAVHRYGPGGEFWVEHGRRHSGLPPGPAYEPSGPEYAPAPSPRHEAPIRPLPIRTWQVWNEANFFYFALPASPTRYASLLKITTPTIKAVDPGAKVILSGLFAKPTADYPRGMEATEFLDRLYRVPGIKSYFDGVSLHPYAVDTETLEEYVEAFHDVTVENHDRVPLYITEMGWGSQPDFQKVAFEQGVLGQVKQLKGAYTYLLENRHRLDVKQVYWFSWKDIQGDCNFCDSVGLFHEGKGFRPKPAWRALVVLAHGRARP
jgi:hypothetical protein